MRRRGTDASAFITTLLLFSSLASAGFADGGVVYVDDDAPAGGDGLSWDAPLRFLQDALDFPEVISEIRVAQGLYRPDRDSATPGGTGDRTASFQLRGGVACTGGYAGYGAADPDARDFDLYESILSGDLEGNDQPGFVNYEDNSLHVVRAGSPDVSIDGFTVTGGNADVSGEKRGAGFLITQQPVTISHCIIRDNFAASDGGGIHATRSIVLDTVTLIRNRGNLGGGIYSQSAGSITILNCVLNSNTADIGGGLRFEAVSIVSIRDTTCIGNKGLVAGGGGFITHYQDAEVVNCVIRENEVPGIGASAGLVFGWGDTTTILDCMFAQNACGSWGGALGHGTDDPSDLVSITNCAFSRNTAPNGGAGIIAAGGDYTITNCTFSQNSTDSIHFKYGEMSLVNCIVWDNDPYAITGSVDVTYSDIEGGHSGVGNINADPLFVQAGTDDLRLSFGSPCIDAGNNDAVPPEVETDLAGNPRIQGGIVDMGAYEGEHEGGLPAAAAHDVDQGEFVFLIPDGAQIDPLTTPMVMFRNVSGPDDASVIVTQIDAAIHEAAEGFSELGSVLQLETSLDAGEYLATIYLPFDLDDVGDLQLSDMEATSFAQSVGNWSLAVALNTVDSPGHPRRIGDRILRLEGGGWGTTLDVGDWGVFWDPSLQRGFTWGNVDYPGDFGFGAALCPPDAHQPPDGSAGLSDLLIVIHAWGAGMGPFDVNDDGTVDLSDLLAVLDAWGLCP